MGLLCRQSVRKRGLLRCFTDRRLDVGGRRCACWLLRPRRGARKAPHAAGSPPETFSRQLLLTAGLHGGRRDRRHTLSLELISCLASRLRLNSLADAEQAHWNARTVGPAAVAEFCATPDLVRQRVSFMCLARQDRLQTPNGAMRPSVLHMIE